jgi:hypothetical protein
MPKILGRLRECLLVARFPLRDSASGRQLIGVDSPFGVCLKLSSPTCRAEGALVPLTDLPEFDILKSQRTFWVGGLTT